MKKKKRSVDIPGIQPNTQSHNFHGCQVFVSPPTAQNRSNPKEEK